ncbi:MAG: FliM/FliN family flagellar motor switch protein [Pirellula sp.]
MPSKNLQKWFPRLRGPIDAIYQPWAANASARISQLLGSPVNLSIAQIQTQQSTTESNTVKSNTVEHSCFDCEVEIPNAVDPWTLSLDSELVFCMIDRLLGAPANASASNASVSSNRVLTAIDWRVASYALEEFIHPCLDLWQSGLPLQTPRAKLHRNQANKSCDHVRIDFELRMARDSATSKGESLWRGAWKIPESFLVANLGRLLFQQSDQASLAVVLARSTISRAELSQLEVGDIISTEQLATDLAHLEYDGDVLFRGQPGTYKGTKAVRLVGSSDRKHRFAS